MTFAEPACLWLLALGLPPLVWAVVRGERRRARALAGLGLALLALARPQLGVASAPAVRAGRDVVFALDASRSMDAQDAAPSRLAAARGAVRALLEASPGDRVGLVVFAGRAFVQLPLTLDRGAFALFLGSVTTATTPDQGTSLAAALEAAAAALERGEGRPDARAIVLLSDGEDLSGRSGDLGRALAAVRRTGAPVLAVGLGRPEGATIPRRDGDGSLGAHRDPLGRVVVTRLAEDRLREVALVLDPDDADAKWNLEVALRRLAEQERRLGPGRRRRAVFGEGRHGGEGYEGRPGEGAGSAPGGGAAGTEGEPARELTEREARRLLAEVEREQLALDRERRARAAGAAGGRADW